MIDGTDRPLVTFAVIAYNQERFIREAVEGAFSQTYQPLEIILSDDCSSDHTFEIMEEMAAAYNGPHMVRVNRNATNLGLVPHLDRVMELVSGRFVVVNAGDDVSLPERTSRLTDRWLTSTGRTMMVHSAAQRVSENGELLQIKRPLAGMMGTPSPLKIVRERLFIIGATGGWDREIYDRFGPLGPNLVTEDRILPYRAAMLGEIEYIDEALVKWRAGGISEGLGQVTGQQFLYGAWHKNRKWDISIDQHIIDCYYDFENLDQEEIFALCRRRMQTCQLAVDLASLSYAGRLALAPNALRLSIEQRSVQPLKYWMYFFFDLLYIPYVDWKSARQTRQGLVSRSRARTEQREEA